ncbi:Aromatic amino acid exporter YddG [Dirofilaria immitis]
MCNNSPAKSTSPENGWRLSGRLILNRCMACVFKIFGKKKILKQQIKKKTWPQRVRGSQWLALKTLGVGPVGASIGADLGGSSKYSSEILED